MYYPEPQDNLPLALRMRGISIGDIGIIKTDGRFQYVFNTFAPRPPPRARVSGGDQPAEPTVDHGILSCLAGFLQGAPSSEASEANNLQVDEDPSINHFGVPVGFVPMPWDPDYQIDHNENKHSKQSELTSEGVAKHDSDANLDASIVPG